MKFTFATILAAALLSACGASNETATGQAKSSETKPVATVIDDTPVEPLQIGGAVTALRTDKDLSDPENAAWRDAQEYRMDLSLAPPVHPSINLRYDPGTAAMPVFLRAASDGDKLFLRLRWPDGSNNSSTGRTDFADGAAVQFSLGDAATTSFMMGAANGPVNIWYWKAGLAQAQNLAAGGFGSTTPLDQAGLASSSIYREKGEWVVVFSRPLAQSGEHQVKLDNGTANLALALWQGDQKQRDGLKHVTMGWVSLQTIQMEPAS